MRPTQVLAGTSLFLALPALMTVVAWSPLPLLNIALSLCVTLVSTRYWWYYPATRNTRLQRVDKSLARVAFVWNHGLIVYSRYTCSWFPSLVGIVAYLCSCRCDGNTHSFVLPHALMHLAFVWQWCRVTAQLT